MANLSNQGVSVDDNDIPSAPKTPPSNYVERRARSSSPVKNRNFILPVNYGNRSSSTLMSHQEEDLRSIIASPTLTPSQLKRISKSPITKKLHVAAMSEKSKYIIPVPFTLNLPPRLTTPITDNNSSCSSLTNSTSPSRAESSVTQESPRGRKQKQGKLVFTMHGYEKVESSSSDEEEELNGKQDMMGHYLEDLKSSRSPLSGSPRSRGMYAKYTSNSDALSIIEEVSNFGSRQNTINNKLQQVSNDEKQLPPTPRPLSEPKFPEVEIKPKLPTKKLTRKPPPPPIESEEKCNKTLPILPSEVAHKHPLKATTIIQPKPSLPSITSTLVNDSHALKIHKRSFSDESQVSSISSLSSIGDFLTQSAVHTRSPPLIASFVPIASSNRVTKVPVNNKFSHETNASATKTPTNKKQQTTIHKQKATNVDTPKQQQSPSKQQVERSIPKTANTKAATKAQLTTAAVHSANLSIPKPQFLQTKRNISDSSTGSNDSVDSTSTWNSIQESIDISPSEKQQPKKEFRKSFPLLFDRKDVMPPQKHTRAMSESSWVDVSEDDTEEIKPLCIHKKDSDASSKQVIAPVAEQLKMDFHFPNTSSNITNNQEIKQRQISGDQSNHKSRYSFYSSTGQIEIPDLDDKRVMDEYSSKAPSSYDGTTFSDIRTQTTASDIHDDDNNNIFLGVPGKQAINHLRQQFNMLGDDSDSDVFSAGLYTAPKLSKTVPTMLSQQAEPKPSSKSPIRHARHRSMFNIDFNPSKDIQANVSHVRAQSMNPATIVAPKDAVAELMNIKVAAPPSKVNYAVDFKESESVADDDFMSPSPETLRRNSKIHASLKSATKTKSKKSKKNNNNNVGSDTESVVIDLTEDEYDLCLINRRDSVLSYKSVTEKLKDGKEVEVVLVDEDIDEDAIKEPATEEEKKEPIRAKEEIQEEEEFSGDDTEDELSSIYSKYRHNWMFRSNTASSSTSSTNSYASVTESMSQLQIKQARKVEMKSVSALTTSGRVLRELNLKRSNGSVSSSSSSYVSSRILHPTERQPSVRTKPAVNQRKSMPILESNYFDYRTSDSYDFNTFMKQRTDSGVSYKP
ncbi:uncharacterized protein SPAPADRAFT_66251 [Spathaspora passalidarum NRRL Y-27907]|uniref:Uncharacterized protein n=1 Tax=Spathaspora passalidarum (strain NRRL Y-27907 / 11-Y1) TaxID=619300 RepID=G3ALM6_SPAPN|nr:uncharacterized protein SPAPADRAFT_66251 [Spathaspora passalidarum NRRL Y-27907]EGW33268.1 hypothetical protein SPAPADRAFT_66251 [Spathaspora passalidarum NRRL Y-27907]